MNSEIDDEKLVASVLASRSLPEATSLALRLLHTALNELRSPRRLSHRRREMIVAQIEGAIRDLEHGLRNSIDVATGDLSKDLLRALGPDVTVCENEGARTILTLMLAALPPKISMGPDRD
jgi:hypothetical protein